MQIQKKVLWACDIEFRIRFWIWTFSRDETSSSGSWSWDARGAVKISWNKKSEEFASKLQIHHWPRMMIAIFEQVRKYLLEEVNIVYECKVCMNFFRWILLLIVLFLLVNVERPGFERNEIERADFLRRSLANLIAHKRSYCQEKFEVRYIFNSHLILCSHHVASSLLLLSKITYLHRYVHWIRPTRELPTSLTRWLGWKPPSFRLLSSRLRRCVVVVVVGGGGVVEAEEVRCIIIISICCHNAVVFLI